MHKPNDLKPGETISGQGVSCRNTRTIYNSRIDVIYGPSLSPSRRAANDKSFWFGGGQREFT